MIKYILIYTLLIYAPFLLAQQDSAGVFYSISNKEIKFNLFRSGGGIIYKDHTVDVPKHWIEVTYPQLPFGYLDKHRDEIIEKLIKLLDDPNKDWSANILLYHITKREAWWLLGVYDKTDWGQKGKTYDSLYWHENYIDK